jgi:hypothetical protein
MSTEMKCPKCGSNQFTAQKKGFNTGVGSVSGTIGGNNINFTCLACGNTFNPVGENLSERLPEDVDQVIINNIRNNGMLEAVKAYKEFSGLNLAAAKKKVDEVAATYNVKSGKSNSGCAGVLLILIIVVSLLAYTL